MADFGGFEIEDDEKRPSSPSAFGGFEIEDGDEGASGEKTPVASAEASSPKSLAPTVASPEPEAPPAPTWESGDGGEPTLPVGEKNLPNDEIRRDPGVRGERARRRREARIAEEMKAWGKDAEAIKGYRERTKTTQVAPELFLTGDVLEDADGNAIKPGDAIAVYHKEGDGPFTGEAGQAARLMEFTGVNDDGKPVFKETEGVSSEGAMVAGKLHVSDEDFDRMMGKGEGKVERSPFEQVRLGALAETGDRYRYTDDMLGTAKAVYDRLMPYAGRMAPSEQRERTRHLSNIYEGKLDSYEGKTEAEKYRDAARKAGLEPWNPLESLHPDEDDAEFMGRIQHDAGEELRLDAIAKLDAGGKLSATEQGVLDKIVKGGIESGGYALEFALPGGAIFKGAQALNWGAKAVRAATMLGSAVPVVATEAASRYQENVTPEYGFDDNGEFRMVAAPDDEEEAAYKAIGGAIFDTAVETGLEAVTMGLLRGAGKATGWALGKATPSAARVFGAKGFNKFMASETGQALRSINRAYQDFTAMTQINSPLGELAEENVQAFEKFLNLDGKTSEHKGFAKEWQDFKDNQLSWQTQWDIFYGLIAQLAIGSAKSTAEGVARHISEADARRDIRMALKRSRISDEAISMLAPKQQRTLDHMWRHYSSNPDELKAKVKNLGISMRLAADELLSRESSKMAADLKRSGIEPEKFVIQTGEDGKLAFRKMMRFGSDGSKVPMNAMTDAAHGVTIVDQGNGTFHVMNDWRGLDAIPAYSFEEAQKKADEEVLRNQQKEADNKIAAQRLMELTDPENGPYRGRKVVSIPSEAALRWQVAQAAHDGKEIFGITRADQLFKADGSLKQPGAGGFHTPDGHIVVILDNVLSPAEMERVLAHEATGHEGVESATGRGANTVEFIQNAQAEGFSKFVLAEQERAVQRFVAAGMDEAMARMQVAMVSSTDEYAREAMARYAQGRLHQPTWYEKRKHELNQRRRDAGEEVPIDQSDLEVMLAEAEKQGAQGENELETLPGDSGVRYEEGVTDEARNGTDEAQPQPEQGEERGQEAPQPEAGAEPGAQAPDAGVVEPSKSDNGGQNLNTAERPAPADTIGGDAGRQPMSESSFWNVMHRKGERRRVPVDGIKIPDTQFKENADPKTGVVKGQELGEYYENAENPIAIYERKDGTMEIVTGRHRLDAAKRSGWKDIDARIFREADGYTPEDMRLYDAVANILDEKGTVKDYVRFFDESGFSEEDAKSSGILNRQKGRMAFGIVQNATDDTRGAIDWEGTGGDGLISAEQAAIIADAAPKQAALQRILVRRALDGVRGKKLAILARSLAEEAKNRKNAPKADSGTQLDLFTSEEDVALLQQEEKRADYRAKKANEYKRIAENLRTAMRKGGRLDLNKDYAKELGISDPKDKAQLAAARDKAVERANYWENAIRLDDADKAQMDADLGIAPKLQLESVTAEQITAEEKKRREKAEIKKRQEAPLKGSGAVNVQPEMDLGQTGQQDLFSPIAEKSAQKPAKTTPASAPNADGTTTPPKGADAPQGGKSASEVTSAVRVKDGVANAKRFKTGDKVSFIEELATMSSRSAASRIDAEIFAPSTEEVPDKVVVSDGEQEWMVDADLLKTPEEMDAFLSNRRKAIEKETTESAKNAAPAVWPKGWEHGKSLDGYIRATKADITALKPGDEVAVAHTSGGASGAKQAIFATVRSVGEEYDGAANADIFIGDYKDGVGYDQDARFKKSEIIGIRRKEGKSETPAKPAAPKSSAPTTARTTAKPAFKRGDRVFIKGAKDGQRVTFLKANADGTADVQVRTPGANRYAPEKVETRTVPMGEILSTGTKDTLTDAERNAYRRGVAEQTREAMRSDPALRRIDAAYRAAKTDAERNALKAQFAERVRELQGGVNFDTSALSGPSGRQKQAGIAYPDTSEEIRSQVSFDTPEIGKKSREDFGRILAKHRPDLDANAVIGEIAKFDTPKKRKAALHWVVRGAIRLPEDAYKVEDALSVAEKAKVDPFAYRSPLELIEAHKDIRPTRRAIDPATVPELSDPRDEGDGIVSYLVQDDREGQAAMRRIIDTHWGEDANPWCLLARGNDASPEVMRAAANLYPGDPDAQMAYIERQKKRDDGLARAWEYWQHYSALPKRVAFKNGRLLAFMATEEHPFFNEYDGGESEAIWFEEQRERYKSETGQSPMKNGVEYTDDFNQWLERTRDEEWWDRTDTSHPDLDWARGNAQVNFDTPELDPDAERAYREWLGKYRLKDTPDRRREWEGKRPSARRQETGGRTEGESLFDGYLDELLGISGATPQNPLGQVVPPPDGSVAQAIDAEIAADEARAARGAGRAQGAPPAPAPGSQGNERLDPGYEPESLGAGVKDPVSRQEIVDKFRELFSDTVAIRGKNTTRIGKYAGHYEPDAGIIRSKDPVSLRTIPHELGHHIDAVLKKRGPMRPNAVKAELIALGKKLYGSKQPAGGYQSEGFAEMVKYYLQGNEEGLKKEAPAVYSWLVNDFGKAHPDIMEKMDALRDMIDRFQNQSGDEAVRAIRAKDPNLAERIVGRLANMIKGLKLTQENWIDTGAFITKGMRASGLDKLMDWRAALKRGDVAEMNDIIENHPVLKWKLYNGKSAARAYHALAGGLTDLSGTRRYTYGDLGMATPGHAADEKLPTFKEIFGGFTPEEMDEFENYAIARIAKEAYLDKGLEFGLTKSEVAPTIAKHARNTKFRDALERYTHYKHGVLHLLVDAGAMSQEQFEEIVKANPIYVKIARRRESADLFRDRMLKKRGKAVNRRTGSGRQVEDIFDAGLVDDERVFSAAFQADLLRSLVNLGKRGEANNAAPGGALQGELSVGANWIHEVPNAQGAVRFTAEQLRKQITDAMRGAAMAPDKAAADNLFDQLFSDGKDILTVFKQKPSEGKNGLVSLYDEDGALHTYELPENNAEGWAKGLMGFTDSKKPNILEQWAQIAAAATRTGATILNPTFALRNIVRDTLHASTVNEFGFMIPGASTVQGIAMDMTGSNAKEIFDAMGIPMGSMLGESRLQSARRANRYLMSRNWFEAQWNKGVKKAIADFVGFSENGTRIKEFKLVRDYMLSHGASEKAADMLAGANALDITIDFQRGGEIAKGINRFIPFFNAGIQGLEQTARALGLLRAKEWQLEADRKRRAGRTVLQGAAWLLMLSLLAELFNRSDDDRKRKIDELKPHERWNYISFGDVRLPVPYEIGYIFSSIPRAVIAELYDGQKGAVAECLGMFRQTLPGISPTDIALVGPALNTAMNEYWHGGTIVPEYVQKSRLSYDWYDERTSEFSKMLGKAMYKVFGHGKFSSPAHIDAFMNGITGNMYGRTLGAIGGQAELDASRPNTWPVVGTFFRNNLTANRLVGEFYERKIELERKKGSGVATDEELAELHNAGKVAKRFAELRKESQKANEDKSLSVTERNDRLEKIVLEMQQGVRDYNKNPSGGDETAYEIEVKAFEKANGEYKKAAKDKSVPRAERDKRLSDIREGDPLMRDDVRGNLLALKENIAKLERDEKMLRENGASKKRVDEVSASIAKGKAEFLDEVRKARGGASVEK